MSAEKSTPEYFSSLADFKKSQAYEALSAEEQDELGQEQGNKKVLVLRFDNSEQAIEFIQKAQNQGLIGKDQGDAALSQIEAQQARSSCRPSL